MTDRKLYTLEQANRTLPLVRRIAEDIVVQYRRWQERVREFEIVTTRSRADLPDARAESIQRDVQALAAEIDGFVAELAELGVEFKDYERGLVDFPGESAGHPVYLCWQLGEPEIGYWHEMDAGFPGRQPIRTLGAPRADASPESDRTR
jgi:hypothetical protein